ncbi:MAG TPA: FecR domain-containing protein [Planctomycetota bacterium]|nr:FecR domain-containing protein [Planctomycetota bacterium]
MKTCAEFREDLGLYLTEALEGAEQASVAEHLERCAPCRRELEELRRLSGLLGRLRVSRPTRALAWGASAAAVALISLGIALASRAPSSILRTGQTVSLDEPKVIALSDGSRMEAQAGARFAVESARHVRLERGEAFFDIAKSKDRFIVETPEGRIEVLGTSFIARVEEDGMNKMMVAAAGGVVVTVAVVTGTVLFRQSPGDPVARVESGYEATARKNSISVRPSPGSGGASAEELRELKARLSQVEKELGALRAAPAPTRTPSPEDVEEAVKALQSRAEREAKTARGALEEDEAWTGFSKGFHGPRAVAGILGLDADRKKAFLEAYQKTVDRIRGLEAERAKITTAGETTQIAIAPYPAEGGAVVSDWTSSLNSLLTPDERDKYQKLNLGFFSKSLGEPERLIVITRSGTTTSVTDVETMPDGKQGSSWKFSGPEDVALRPYRHLLAGK